jgi:hypothetical protein
MKREQSNAAQNRREQEKARADLFELEMMRRLARMVDSEMRVSRVEADSPWRIVGLLLSEPPLTDELLKEYGIITEG